MKLEPRHHRPQQLLRLAEEQYPGALDALALMREDKGRGLPDWPQWCYLPIAAGLAVATGGKPLEEITFRERLAGASAGAPLVALAAWRVTQGIWDFDRALLDALWTTPIEGQLPTELLYRLPEWSLYLCLPEHDDLPPNIRGAFVHLESDANSGRAELRLALDLDGPVGLADRLPSLPLHLDAATVDECLQRAADEAVRTYGAAADFTTPGFPDALAAIRAGFASQVGLARHLLSLVLYLCSQEPDLTRRPPPGPTLYRKLSPKPAQQPTLWPVGLRIGAALRAASTPSQASTSEPTGRAVRPHIRKAHWHCYWTGKRTETSRGERLELRWIAPTPIGVGELAATVHPVK